MKKFLLLFLLATPAFADSTMSLEVATGVFNSGKNSLAETKLVKLGLEEDLWYNLKHRVNGGFWLDNAGDGRKGSGFLGYQWGFVVNNGSTEVGVYSGPTYITTTDTYLGGCFQFNETIYFGISDKDYNFAGFAYNHFSSAGIETPNMGRDFAGVMLKFPF